MSSGQDLIRRYNRSGAGGAGTVVNLANGRPGEHVGVDIDRIVTECRLQWDDHGDRSQKNNLGDSRDRAVFTPDTETRVFAAGTPVWATAHADASSRGLRKLPHDSACAGCSRQCITPR